MVTSLQQLSSSFWEFAPFLDNLPQLLPEGLWLEKITIESRQGNYGCKINGAVFLDSEYREREATDDFLANLLKDEAVVEIFPKISLTVFERREKEEFQYASFTIELSEDKDKSKPGAGLAGRLKKGFK